MKQNLLMKSILNWSNFLLLSNAFIKDHDIIFADGDQIKEINTNIKS